MDSRTLTKHPPNPHVFVTRGDLNHVECDARMVPTDRTLSVRSYWTDGNDRLQRAIREFDDTNFFEGLTHAASPRWWDDFQPMPVFTAVPFSGFDDPGEFTAIIDEFVRVGTAAAGPPRHGRPLPLLAMPIIGAGGGGGGGTVGEIIRVVLEAATSASRSHDADIVVVVRDPAQLGLAQRIRKDMDTDPQWAELSADLLDASATLARECAAGKIVPFLGAGVSMSAGSPSWAGLVDGLISRVSDKLTIAERTELGEKSPLDQAEILKNLYPNDDDFNREVISLVDKNKYGLAPTLIANLPLEQAITLNYDRLFEIASADAGHPCAVIPGDEDPDATRWLLKMHGDAKQSASIVLTRSDYLGFDANRNVLAALVKASLVTKRLVFIGFGLSDDHFHQILHDVREVSPEMIADKALALTLSENSLDAKAWESKIALQPMSSADTVPPVAGRVLEIFLDRVLMLATDSREYLLDPAYTSQLTPAETRLKQLITNIHALGSAADGDDPSVVAALSAIQGFGTP